MRSVAFALFTRARLLLNRHNGGERLRRRRLRFMLRTGQLIHPASHPASQRRTGASLPGTLASPGTGLTPAGCPELQEQRLDRLLQRPSPVPSWAHTNIRSMRRYGFHLTEHHPEKPWLIISSRHEEVELPDHESFFEWSAKNYPRERYSVDVDPWTLSPTRGV
jgi:hypothetical protein